jgi:hypothetical protein
MEAHVLRRWAVRLSTDPSYYKVATLTERVDFEDPRAKNRDGPNIINYNRINSPHIHPYQGSRVERLARHPQIFSVMFWKFPYLDILQDHGRS